MSSRNEQLLEALLNGEAPNIVPQSRMEALLLALCQNGTGGGGGGGSTGGGGGASELELLFDITTDEEVSAINAVLEKPGYFSELHIAISAVGTASNSANKPIFISVNRQTYNDGGCAFHGGMVMQSGLYANSKIDVIVGNDIAFYTNDCRRGRTTAISQACAHTNHLSRAIELTSLGFGTQNGAGFYGAGSRVLAYGRRIG